MKNMVRAATVCYSIRLKQLNSDICAHFSDVCRLWTLKASVQRVVIKWNLMLTDVFVMFRVD